MEILKTLLSLDFKTIGIAIAAVVGPVALVFARLSGERKSDRKWKKRNAEATAKQRAEVIEIKRQHARIDAGPDSAMEDLERGEF